MFNLNPMKKWIFYITAVLIISPFPIVFSEEVPSEETKSKPLWELGIFAGVGRLPHYRGSDEYNVYALPIPYAVIRGKYLQADREGVRGLFYSSERVETSVSLFGNPPVDDDNEARKGMKELDSILELGPCVKYFLNNRYSETPLYLQAALRGVISASVDSGLDFSYQGYRGSLQLIYLNRKFWGHDSLYFGCSAGVDYGDKIFHQYFYEVKPEEALPQRPAYDPKAGYSGAMVSVNIFKKINKDWAAGAYARWENLDGVVYESSPLVREKNDWIIGMAVVWKFYESKKRVHPASLYANGGNNRIYPLKSD